MTCLFVNLDPDKLVYEVQPYYFFKLLFYVGVQLINNVGLVNHTIYQQLKTLAAI